MQNPETAEMAVLGAIEYNPAFLPEVMTILEERDFFSGRHRYLYGVMQSLYESAGGFDLVAIRSRLDLEGKLEEIGGISYLQALAAVCEDPYNWRANATIVKNAALTRQAGDIGVKLSQDSGNDVFEALVGAQHALDDLSVRTQGNKIVPITKIIEANRERLALRRAHPNPVQGVRTNMATLNRAIGGFRDYFTVVIGGSNTGKSTLLASFVRDFIFLEQGPGFIMATESPVGAWTDKVASATTGIDIDLIETGQLSEEQNALVQQAYDDCDRSGIIFYDENAPSMSKTKPIIKTLVRKYGIKWILIDSATNIFEPGYDLFRERQYVSNTLLGLCREEGVPIICSSQITKEAALVAKVPDKEQIFGGSSLGNDADVVLSIFNPWHFIHLDKIKQEDIPHLREGQVITRIVKHRWKRAGNVGVALQFVGGAGHYESDDQAVVRAGSEVSSIYT